MKRRQFVQATASTLLLSPLLASLIACGDDPASPSDAGQSNGDGDKGDGDGDKGDGDGDKGDGDKGDGDGDKGDGDGDGDGDAMHDAGTGKHDAGTGHPDAGAPAEKCANGAKDTMVSSQHPGDGAHHVTIPKADVTSSTAKTYTSTGKHTHKITLEPAQLAMLAAGKSVKVTSTADGGGPHTHDFTVSCA